MINVGEETLPCRGSRTGAASRIVEPMRGGGGGQSSRGKEPPLGLRPRKEPRATATRESEPLAVLLDLTGSESGPPQGLAPRPVSPPNKFGPTPLLPSQHPPSPSTHGPLRPRPFPPYCLARPSAGSPCNSPCPRPCAVQQRRCRGQAQQHRGQGARRQNSSRLLHVQQGSRAPSISPAALLTSCASCLCRLLL